MKQFNPVVNFIILSASLFFFSCQKQLRWPDDSQFGIGEFPPTDCKPAAFCLQSEGAPGNSWNTFAQKWYVNNELTYLKASIGPSASFAGRAEAEPAFKTDWAQLVYYFNQVYLHDVAANKPVMRVTLDNEGLPAASYYQNETGNSLQYDTTYYYHTGERLDSTISIYMATMNSSTPVYGWQKYKFMYDVYGSIVKIEGFPSTYRLLFQYDYTRPVSGIMSNYHLTTPFKLMEYMELVKLPIRHALHKIELGQYSLTGPDNFTVLVRQQYQDYEISSTGLVHSYLLNSHNGKFRFYNGWECGTVTSPMNGSGAQPGIASLDEFKKLYPFRK